VLLRSDFEARSVALAMRNACAFQLLCALSLRPNRFCLGEVQLIATHSRLLLRQADAGLSAVSSAKAWFASSVLSLSFVGAFFLIVSV